MTEPTFFRLSISNNVAHLRLNRPDKANGMNEAFWVELPAIVKELESDMSVRALLISGEGKHFSGGIDVSVFSYLFDVMDQEPARVAIAIREDIMHMQNTFTVLEKARFPVIAAIHGVCMGAAVDFITACDIRIAATGSKFSVEEVNVGMAADVGTLQRLPKLIAPGIVKELAYTGRTFTAEEAHSWGLLNSIHADKEETLEAGKKLAAEIAGKSPVAVTGIKRAIDYVRDHSVEDGLEQIATWNAGALRANELMTAIGARKERKEAVFDNLIQTNPPRLPEDLKDS